VIVTWDAPSSFAAKAATKTTPIVFITEADPVAIGLVQSFSRPSGNLTGIYNLVIDAGPKHLEMLHELLPTARSIVSLLNPGNPNAHPFLLQTQAAADALGLRLQVLTAHTEDDLEPAFGIMVQRRADALVVIATRSSSLGVSRLSRSRPATQYPRFIPPAGSPIAAG
jgi:putative tryptophan/tyrosine transport system substrate-binding protein